MKVPLPVWHVDDNPIDVRLAKLFSPSPVLNAMCCMSTRLSPQSRGAQGTYQGPRRRYPGVLLKFVECYKMETNASVVKSANWTC